MVSGSNQPLKLVDRAQGPGAPDASDVQWEAYEVPQLLTTLREHAGLSLDQVAATLRIRAVYLRAIEDGRFDDLPGPTYAVGFVRAYADHLGLDPETTVRRFKAERDGISRRQELVFPVPAPDARVPGRSLIGLSVILAMAAYGGWYYLSSQDRSVIELVEQVPANLQTMLSPNGSPAPGPAAANAESPAPAVEPVAPAIQREAVNPVVAAMLGDEAAKENGDSGSAAPAAEAERIAAQPAAGATPSVFSIAEPVATATSPAPPLAVVAAESLEPIMTVPNLSPDEAAAATPAPPEPPVGGDVAVDAAPSRTVAAAPEQSAAAEPVQVASAAPGPGAREYGATDSPGRVVLEATEENWIQVRSRTNQAIFTQILHAGDRYLVPEEDGLSLTTGKAGALIVTVDGQRLNPLGAVGAVRRGVDLDAGSLLREFGAAGGAGD
jgi:cytoskeletal protein RodZ